MPPKLVWNFAAALWATVLGVLATHSAQADIAVVSSAALTKGEAIGIFQFSSHTFSDGTRVRLIFLPRDHRTTRDLAILLGTTPARLHERAEQNFATGKYNLLNITASDREALRAVTKTPESIGYVESYLVFDGDVPSVIRLR